MTINIMLDLETWGTRPGRDLRSIGAVVFDPVTGYVADTSEIGLSFDPHHCFYIATDNPCKYPHGSDEYADLIRKYPLTRDPSTVAWWADQSDEAQAAFADPVDLREALVRFADWMNSISNHRTMTPNQDVRLWSHGAAFDPPILAAAYDAVGLPVPWHYRAPRDTRTLFDVAGITDHSAWLNKHPGPLGVSHHALDDAICQARAVCAAYDECWYTYATVS
jgi:hypothetical protein